MTERIAEIIREYFWWNTGPVAFTWGTAVIRQGMIPFVVSGLGLALGLCGAAWVMWVVRRWVGGR